MPINLGRMKKSEIIWLYNHRCRKHGVRYIEHPNCFSHECPDRERIGFLDIETTNLHASFGIVLCYAIKDGKSDKIYHDCITAADLRGSLDKRVVESAMRDLSNFDRICTFYGSRFDIPFLRTRAIALGVDFPEFGSIVHNDIYYIARNRLRLHSNRLEQVCRTLFGSTEKTRIESDKWVKALMGDVAALKYIEDHCILDVKELEKVHKAIVNYSRRQDTSI